MFNCAFDAQTYLAGSRSGNRKYYLNDRQCLLQLYAIEYRSVNLNFYGKTKEKCLNDFSLEPVSLATLYSKYINTFQRVCESELVYCSGQERDLSSPEVRVRSPIWYRFQSSSFFQDYGSRFLFLTYIRESSSETYKNY